MRKERSRVLTYFFFLCLILVISSCGRHKTVVAQYDIPADSIISRSQMVQMIADIHVMEAALQEVKKKGINEQEMSVFYYNELFSKYHMTGRRFRLNLSNYLGDSEQFYLIYEDVKTELDRRVRLQKPGITKRKK